MRTLGGFLLLILAVFQLTANADEDIRELLAWLPDDGYCAIYYWNTANRDEDNPRMSFFGGLAGVKEDFGWEELPKALRDRDVLMCKAILRRVVGVYSSKDEYQKALDAGGFDAPTSIYLLNIGNKSAFVHFKMPALTVIYTGFMSEREWKGSLEGEEGVEVVQNDLTIFERTGADVKAHKYLYFDKPCNIVLTANDVKSIERMVHAGRLQSGSVLDTETFRDIRLLETLEAGHWKLFPCRSAYETYRDAMFEGNADGELIARVEEHIEKRELFSLCATVTGEEEKDIKVIKYGSELRSEAAFKAKIEEERMNRIQFEGMSDAQLTFNHARRDQWRWALDGDCVVGEMVYSEELKEIETVALLKPRKAGK